MRADEVFQKTVSGRSEVNEKSAGLSMRERRVLILINGQRTLSQVQKMSLVETIDTVIDKLLSLNLVEPLRADSRITSTAVVSLPESTMRAAPPARASTPEPEVAASGTPTVIAAQTFMRNSLLRLANRVRVSGLIDNIDNATDSRDLKAFVKPWCDAIAESPTGIYEVDDLKASLLEILSANNKH